MPAILLSFKLDFHKVETFFAPLAIIFIAFVVGNFLKILIRRYIRKSARVLNVDPTNYSFLQNAVSMVVFLAAVFFVFWSIPELHDLGKTLFAGAGIFAAILGFASQEAFSNIISGIFIVIYKPFSVGDNIKLLSNSQAGTVEDITLRHTILKSIENRRIVIPNSVISREQILNSNIKDQRIQLFLEVVITYESKHNRAMEIMKEEALKHPLFADARTVKAKMDAVPPVEVSVIALDLTGVKLRACIWTNNDSDAFHMKCDLLKTLKERFELEKIELARENDRKDFRRH